jgi:8-oxo-dGTP pyrophosphatase MutT (NUDIX family)
MGKINIQKIDKEPIVRFNGEIVELPEDLQGEVDKYWRESLANGKNFFNGEVFAIKDVRNEKENIEIIVRRTNFAHFLYARQKGEKLNKYRLRTVAAAALILSNDNKIVLGKMGEHTSLAGRYQMVGGGLDDKDLQGGIFDLRHSLNKEIQEEIGLDVMKNDFVESLNVCCIKIGGNNNIAIIYKVILNQTGEEFLKHYKNFINRLQDKSEIPEFLEVHVLSNDKKDIEHFIKINGEKMSEYLPGILRTLVTK